MAQRILIAEDEPNIALSLEFLLKEAGYEVAVARDGSEALRLAEALRPDLLVLDIMLPEVSGFDVCRRIRAEAKLAGTRILVLTARGQAADAERIVAAGAHAYMIKPFATKELVRIVGELLGRRP
jgi:DNA-binding response OmpR family regulator